MAKSASVVELNTFVAGLITEATPLTFPANASLDEDNFVLDRKGLRQRRLGMDLEEDHQVVATSITIPATGDVPITSYRWRNVGGIADKNVLVVQVANELKFFNQDSEPLSSGLITTHLLSSTVAAEKFSYTVVDGLLVVATGHKDIHVFELTPENTLIVSASSLKIRDQFGLEDVVNGVDLREGNGVSIRPATQSNNHIYNLRNQTWGQPRKPHHFEILVDPITEFFNEAGSKFPSNSDAVNYALYPDATDPTDRLTQRFIAEDLISNPVGTFPAPKGFFIIDALNRGSSRLDEYTKLRAENPSLNYPIASLPLDSTPGGSKVVTEYAGRVWFSGFSGDVIDGDAHSPRMASYVLFSQLVEDPSDITKCYQDGDPTSIEVPDLLDTDGGFIRVDGAYGITALVNVGSALLAVASNGVWMIQGGSGYGFKATNYMVSKITSRGCESPGSIVVIDNAIMYWADDGIYSLAPNQFGDYEASNLTRQSIQTFFNAIPALDRANAKGVHDTYEQKVRWIYNNRLAGTGEARELILDLSLSAFYTNSIKNVGGLRKPLVIGGFTLPPFISSEITDAVTVNSVAVTVSGSPVTVTMDVATNNIKEVFYLSVTDTSPTIKYSFSHYRDPDFKDWTSFNGVGVDAKAFMLTGWLSGGDYQRYKQIPSLTFHFNKTENGFETDGSGDFVPLNQSSCLVSAQWDWANHANSGQWGRQFQAYRFRRHYMPADISDPFNNGYRTVVTKNRLRGKGRVLSILMETEPGKDCQLLGWSMVMMANSNV